MIDAKELFVSGVENFLRGDYELAKILFEKSLKLSPDKISTLINYSATLIELGLLEDAINVCDHILSLDNFNIQGMVNKSNIFKLKKNYNESISILNKIIDIDKNNIEAYNNLGIIYHELEDYDSALKNYETAQLISDDVIEPKLNMASSLLQINRIFDAINLLESVIEDDNNSYEAYCNLGIAYTKLNNIPISIQYFDKSLNLKSNYHKAIWNKSLALLLSCDYINGFKLYESRFYVVEFNTLQNSIDKPIINLLKNKLQIKNKKIYVIYEQGYGDTIQFCRYINQMVDYEGIVTLKVQKSLLKLIKNSIKKVNIVGEDFIPSEFDYYCSLLSLPYIFETSYSNINYTKKYIYCSDDKELYKKFINLEFKFNKKIGIVWRGNRHHKNDSNRSIPLSTLVNYLSKDYDYVSLQIDISSEEIEILNKNNIKYFTDIQDFNDTACLCENLNLVISVDTSVAHLSCALGIKTIILLPYSPDWRWGLNNEKTAWYSSAILLRQFELSNWKSVLNNLSTKIKKLFN